MMFRISNTALLLLAAQVASAQSSTHLKQAERYYSAGDHYNAAVQYEQYLGFRKATAASYAPYTPQRTGGGAATTAADRSRALARLAECYFLLHDYAKAADYYGKAVAANQSTAADKLRYAQSLRATGRGAEAEPLLHALATTPGTEGDAAKLELGRLEFARAQQQNPDGALFTISKLSGAANEGTGNYAAVAIGNELYFTSSRRADSSKGPAWNHLYRMGADGVAQQVPLEVPGMSDVGLACFSADGRRAYFSAWTRSAGRNMASIYSATLSNGAWSAPVKLNAQVNMPGTSNAQPWLVESGGKQLLFFSSDRTGGEGGYDLWYAPVDDANTEYAALNAGRLLNTTADEGAPFFHGPSKTFVFASNGRPGMGGFDLYGLPADIVSGVPAFLESPRNLGAPVNSVKNDSYFYSASPDSLFRNAYLSSDRASDCCFELFTASKKEVPRVFRRSLTGTVTQCGSNSPLGQVSVEVEGTFVRTDEQGRYRIELAPEAVGERSVLAGLEGFGQERQPLRLAPATGDTTYVVDICLKGRTRNWEPVLFDFDRDVLTDVAKQQLDAVFEDLKADPALRVQVGGYTDAKGELSYNDDLAQRRAQVVRDYLWKKGIDAARLEVKAFGECCPRVPEKNSNGADAPQGRRQNRRVELKVY